MDRVRRRIIGAMFRSLSLGSSYLIVRRRAPTGDFGIRNSARLEAVGAKSTECYAGGAVEAAYC
jgi:hypothetical protein